MNAELKQKWIAALRSGDYVQGRLAMEHEGAYCCLGVLCKVADVDIDHRGTLPIDFRDSVGLADHQGNLIHMNDIQYKTFAEIADYIEANL